MLDIGMLELSLVAVVALLVLGPERLPHAMRSVGHTMGRIKGMMSHFQQQMEVQARNLDMQERLEKNRQALAEYERQLAGQILPDESSPSGNAQPARRLSGTSGRQLAALPSPPERLRRSPATQPHAGDDPGR